MQYFARVNPAGHVKLDDYICDLNLEITNDGHSCYPLSSDGFSYMWAGAKSNYGIRSGKACYEVKITEYCDVLNKEISDTHVVRVGWSTDSANLQLGEDKNSFGFGGTGKKSLNRKFLNFGRRFERGDVVGCYLSIENGWVDISYSVNGRFCGSAFKIRWMTDEALYPHILTKNSKLDVNFGQASHPYFSLQPGYKLLSHFPPDLLVPAVRPPLSQKDCEIIMMVGLPGVGKSTWAMNYAKLHPSKKYVVLGTDSIIDKMRIMGVPRKLNFGGRWEILIKQATECFNILLKKASGLSRNLILDQTNVYATARRRKVNQYRGKGYSICAMVLVPRDEDMINRSKQRTLEEGKEIPEEAVLNMKANFSLPEEEEGMFDSITFLELQRTEAQILVEQYNLEAMKKGLRSNRQMGLGSNKNQTERKRASNFYQPSNTTPIPNSPHKRKDDYRSNSQTSNYQDCRKSQKMSDLTSGPPEKNPRSDKNASNYNNSNFNKDWNKQTPSRSNQYQQDVKPDTTQMVHPPNNQQPTFSSQYNQDRKEPRHYGNLHRYDDGPRENSQQYNSYSQPNQSDEYYKQQRKQSIELFQSKWEQQSISEISKPDNSDRWSQGGDHRNVDEYDPVSNSAVKKTEPTYTRNPQMQADTNRNDPYHRQTQDGERNNGNHGNERQNPQYNYRDPLEDNSRNVPEFGRNRTTTSQDYKDNLYRDDITGSNSSFDRNQEFGRNNQQQNMPYFEQNTQVHNFNDQVNIAPALNTMLSQFGNPNMPPNLNMPNIGMPPNFNMANSGMPPNFNIPNSGMPPNSNMPNSGMPPNLNMSNNGMPPNLNMSNSGMPPNLNMPNGGMTPNSNMPNTGMPPNFQENQSYERNMNNMNPNSLNDPNYPQNNPGRFEQGNFINQPRGFNQQFQHTSTQNLNSNFAPSELSNLNRSPRNIDNNYKDNSEYKQQNYDNKESSYNDNTLSSRNRGNSRDRHKSPRSLNRGHSKGSGRRSEDKPRSRSPQQRQRSSPERKKGRRSVDRRSPRRSDDRSKVNRDGDRNRENRGGDRNRDNRGGDRSKGNRGGDRNRDNRDGDRNRDNKDGDRNRDNRVGDKNSDNRGGDRNRDNRDGNRNRDNRDGNRNRDNRGGVRNGDNRSGDRNVDERRNNSRRDVNRGDDYNSRGQNDGYDSKNRRQSGGYNQNDDLHNSRSNDHDRTGSRNDDFNQKRGFDPYNEKNEFENQQKLVENWELEQAGLNEQEKEALSQLATVDFDQLKAGLVTLKKSQEMGQSIFEDEQVWNENQEFNQEYNQGESDNMGIYPEGGFNPNMGAPPQRFPGMYRGRPRLRGGFRGMRPRGGLLRPMRPRMPLDQQHETGNVKKPLLDTPFLSDHQQEDNAPMQDMTFPPRVRGPRPRMPLGYRGMGPPRMGFRGRFPPPGMRMMRMRGRPMRPRMPNHQ